MAAEGKSMRLTVVSLGLLGELGLVDVVFSLAHAGFGFGVVVRLSKRTS